MTYDSFGPPQGDADDVALGPPSYLLTRLGAVVLEPSRAAALPGVSARSTVYVQTCLLVDAGVDLHDVLPVVSQVAEQLGARVDVDQTFPAPKLTSASARVGVTRLVLSHGGYGVAPPPDAWMVLQGVRERMGVTDEISQALGLDHVLQSTAAIRGSNPFHQSNPFAATSPYPERRSYAGGSSSAQLEAAASAFTPVTWLGPAPKRRPDGEIVNRRPVVAILDTGCGQHPWLDHVVQKGASIDGRTIGRPDSDPELNGDLDGPLDGELDSYTGHGTFVTGLVHVTCPDANIVSYRVLDSDGSGVESDFLGVLVDILESHRRAVDGEPGGQMVDIIVLTCGYYHETPVEELSAISLSRVLREFGRLGVAVVVAAGNDATTRPMFPAGLEMADETDVVPVTGVGALNPDMKSVALFSNAGPWVTAYRPGVACVSTMPALWGDRAPLARTTSYGRVRASVDPDNFTAGFATGSGTSFAAAVFAGELARRLGSVNSDDVAAFVAERRHALESMTGL